MPPRPHVNLLHAEASLIVVEKPAGVLAVPGRGEAGRDNLAARVQALFADALVVHRIDMSTSGLMLFARGAAMQRQLSMAFARGEVAKHYVAVVEGDVQGESGTIAAALAADWPNRPRQVVDPLHGKPSLTRWQVLSRGDGHTRLELEPLTGRTHQLRVHLQWLGHPIRGDALYAPPPLRAERLLLHACRLAFVHPLGGAPCRFESSPDF
ncbi:MAG: RluA family pseudouridine synthase [Burkholderiaceae bacterium]|jgi:tRNA pseudouridine32 synthase/23S rRNA pseudouridine746 synthase|nr:RluA family pseudouridine synthase [Burkholderiaceae bacterium]